MFHYHEIITHRNEGLKYQNEFVVDIVKILLDKLDMLTLFIDNDMGKRYFEMKDIKKLDEDISAENFEVEFEKLKKLIPETMTAKYERPETKSNAPKVDRKKFLGITDE